MTTNTEIRIAGPTLYNTNFPPRDAKKGYVAKITGRKAGPMKYEREFMGEEAVILQGDEGLYERQVGEKKGGCTRYYHVIVDHPEHGLMMSKDCETIVPKIVKMLDEGISIDGAIEVTQIQPSERVEGRMIFVAVPRTVTQAKKAAKSATVDSAIAHCLEVLKLMPEKEQKAVLREVKKALA